VKARKALRFQASLAKLCTVAEGVEKFSEFGSEFAKLWLVRFPFPKECLLADCKNDSKPRVFAVGVTPVILFALLFLVLHFPFSPRSFQ
jgi:hypothetical protein